MGAGVQPRGGVLRGLGAATTRHPLAFTYLTVVPAAYALCCASSTVASSDDVRPNGPSSAPLVESSSTNASSNVTPTSGSEPKTPKVASTRQAQAAASITTPGDRIIIYWSQGDPSPHAFEF